MPNANLTDAAVRAAKPGSKPFKLFDGGGLFLLVSPSGSKTWRYRYKLEGKEGLFTLGTYPDKSLAAARAGADAARALVREGRRPGDVRAEERRRNLEEAEERRRAAQRAFSTLAEAWFEEGQWAASTREAKRTRLDNQILPALGALPMRDVDVPQIRELLLSGCPPWTVAGVRGDLNGIFRFAMKRGLVEWNPLPGLQGLVKLPKSESKAVLNREQIRAFFEGVREHRGVFDTFACFHLVALTACRPGEAVAAEWSEIDLPERLWRRPGAKMKTGRDHATPLSDQAVAVLEELRTFTGRGRYLFPSRDRKGHANTSRLAVVMKRMQLGPRTSPHCWRATFSTWANEQGYSWDAVERQLAHEETSKVRAAYNRAMLLPERRKMMQAWADYLDATQADNVVPMRRAGA